MSNHTLETLLYIAICIVFIILIALSIVVLRYRKIYKSMESEKIRLRQEISMMDTNLDILEIIKEHNESTTDQNKA